MTQRMRQLISENTPISIGLLVTIIGGVFWLSAFYAKAQNTAQDVSEIKQAQQEYNKTLISVDERLSRIEGMLDTK